MKDSDLSEIVALSYVILVPSSIARLAHGIVRDGSNLLGKSALYTTAGFIESYRIYGYYKLAEMMIEKLA